MEVFFFSKISLSEYRDIYSTINYIYRITMKDYSSWSIVDQDS